MTRRAVSVVLPFPTHDISPNSRKHWRAKAAAVASARLLAKTTAKRCGAGLFDRCKPMSISYELYPPSARWDDDNMIGACKAYRDGVCDALGVNDRQIRSGAWIVGDTEQPGRVVITIYQER